MSRVRGVLLLLLLVVGAFLAVSALALWEDGRRFAPTTKAWAPAPNGVKDASYLDASRFEWRSEEELNAYAREHRLGLVRRIEEGDAP